jgi:hypothetical protein
MSQNEIKSASFTSDTWKRYIDKVAKDKENVEDIVVETMAKLLRRQIIVYSRSYTDEISRKKLSGSNIGAQTYNNYQSRYTSQSINQSQLIFPLLDVLLSCSLDGVPSYRLSKL